jgi:hypothetical protein
MSFIHIVTFKWKFPDQSAKAAAAADALRAFVADLDGVESYSVAAIPASPHRVMTSRSSEPLTLRQTLITTAIILNING